MHKRAIILAGGKGTRLRPYTAVLPKPLMPLGEYPILEIIIRQLVISGFNHVTLAVNHQAQIIEAFFQDGSKWGIKIDYSLETKALGTMGPLRLINDLPENFLVMNGDILTDLKFYNLLENHSRSSSIFSIAAKRREQLIDYGVLMVSDENNLVGFKEKPKDSYLVSMGIYVANRQILDYIPADKHFGFDNLMSRLLAEKKKIGVHEHEGYWMDIGRPDDYESAIDDFEEMKSKLFNEEI